MSKIISLIKKAKEILTKSAPAPTLQEGMSYNQLKDLEKAVYKPADPKNPGISDVGVAVREAQFLKDPSTVNKIKEAFPHIQKAPEEHANWLASFSIERAKNIIVNEKDNENRKKIETLYPQGKAKMGGKQRKLARQDTAKIVKDEE
jgi:hypothetical protein